ncbi:carboxypeptidase regulatory-like domain-containing protein [Myxococcaceae bacterium JPH2]|nr:carboxypeptidase regulatory-like domain-containing protein [Myxococcaceae bacterium JPH2]
MRRWTVAVVVALVGLVLALGLLVHRAPRKTKPHDDAAQSQTSAPRTAPTVLVPTDTRPSQGTAHIRGIVFDERGPVAGARVLATRAEPGETLSERTCEPPPDPEQDAEQVFEKTPVPCSQTSHRAFIDLVRLREGEAPVYAETVSAPGGTFTLEGLPDGIFTLWAESARGATVRFGVFTGTEGLELHLGGASNVAGVVWEEDSFTPIPHARVTAVSDKDTRFFDAVADKEGRFQLGPLPDEVNILVVVHADGWNPAIVPLPIIENSLYPVRLSRPRVLHGRVEERGVPVAGAKVHLELQGDGMGAETMNTTSDEQGRFVFESLPIDAYEVTARHAKSRGRALGSLSEPQPAEVVISLVDMLFAEGSVRDDTGKPVTGATVALTLENGPYLRVERQVHEDGHFRVGPLEPGTYTVRASAPGYLSYHDGTLSLAADTKPLELVLQRASLIEGQVLDGAKQPVASVTIEACLMGPRTLSAIDTLTCERGMSDSDGHFEVEISKPGEYRVEAQSEQHLSVPVTVRGPAQGVLVTVRRGARISGDVLDAKDQPQESASISLWENSPSDEPVPFPVRTVTADAQGHFTLQGLPAGHYVVEATQTEGGVERTATQNLDLSDDAEAQVTVRFEAGWSLAGVVVDGAGHPIPDARLRATVAQNVLPSWKQGIVSTGYRGVAMPLGARTGPDGRFVLRQLMADAYDLEVLKSDFVCRDANPCQRVERGQPEARVVMERVAQVRGRVEGPDGAPLTQFWVNTQSFANKTGTFSLPINETGTVPFTITVPKLAPLFRSVEVRRGEDVDLGTLRMEHGRTLSGRVVDAETSQPLEVGLLISALSSDPDYPQQHRLHHSSADGTFRLEHISTSPFALKIDEHRAGYLPKELVITSDIEQLTVRMERGARLEVDVRDAHGQPLPATVELNGGDLGDRRIGPEDPKVVTGLPPGAYVVRADAESHAHIPSQTVTVPATGKVSITLTEQVREGGATLKVHVMDRNVEQLLWVPGIVPFPLTMPVIDQVFDQGTRPDAWEPMDIAVFHHLPPGPSTLVFTYSWGDTSLFAKEDINLPAEGTVTREVRPKWTEVQNP